MRNKAVLFPVALVGLAMLAGLLGGCGSTSTSSLYSVPNWMPDGRIICGKLVVTTSQQLYGGGISESHSYVAAFYPSGTGEVNLFEGGVGDGVNVMTCSPIGEMIAGIGSGKIIISDYKGNMAEVPNTSNVKYLDWSPDATKLVYSDDSRDLYVINRDGTGRTKITTSAEAVAWRVGDKIVFVKYRGTDYARITSINSDGSSEEITSLIGTDVQKNDALIYYRGRGDLSLELTNAVRSANLDGSGDSLKISSYQPSTIKLSFDTSIIVGGKTGDPGVWLINVDGTGFEKIR